VRLELFIALRHIRTRKRQSLLSIAAIGIAVMILMVSQAFMAGFTHELYSTTVDQLPHVVVTPQKNEQYIHLYKNIVADMNSMEGVVAASPYLMAEASFSFKGKSSNVLIKGVIPSAEDIVSRTSKDIVNGEFNQLEHTKNTVIIGTKLAEKLEIQPGDIVEISFPNANPMSLKVIGIFSTGTPLDEKLTYSSLKTVQDFLGTQDVINGISLRIEDFNDDREIAESIKKIGYNAKGWTENNPEIIRTIAIESSSNKITLGFILLIASFGVVSTLNMIVMSKVKEIGILRAMGMEASGIRTIFLLESGILGLAGAMVGVAAGTIIATAIGSFPLPEEFYGISSIPVIIKLKDVMNIIIIVFLLNLAAGIYPARRAANLNPVEAIATH